MDEDAGLSVKEELYEVSSAEDNVPLPGVLLRLFPGDVGPVEGVPDALCDPVWPIKGTGVGVGEPVDASGDKGGVVV